MGAAKRDQACSTRDKEMWRSCLCWGEGGGVIFVEPMGLQDVVPDEYLD